MDGHTSNQKLLDSTRGSKASAEVFIIFYLASLTIETLFSSNDLDFVTKGGGKARPLSSIANPQFAKPRNQV